MNKQQAMILVDLKKSKWWELVDQRLSDIIQWYTDVLTGDSQAFTITEQFNDKVYTKYDLLRISRKMLMEIRDIPDWLISWCNPIEQLDVYDID